MKKEYDSSWLNYGFSKPKLANQKKRIRKIYLDDETRKTLIIIFSIAKYTVRNDQAQKQITKAATKLGIGREIGIKPSVKTTWEEEYAR